MPIQDLVSTTTNAVKNADPDKLRILSEVCFAGGFASIVGSIVAWGFKKGTDADAKAERLGIFIGLWAPTFFILSNRFERYAHRSEEKKGPGVA